MRVLVDTCVIIDALQSRVPFSEAAQKLFIYSANKQFEGYITAKSVAVIDISSSPFLKNNYLSPHKENLSFQLYYTQIVRFYQQNRTEIDY